MRLANFLMYLNKITCQVSFFSVWAIVMRDKRVIRGEDKIVWDPNLLFISRDQKLYVKHLFLSNLREIEKAVDLYCISV